MALILKISDDLKQRLVAEAIRCYPDEACGFLLGRVGSDRVAVEFMACNNIQNQLHKADPERYPRMAQTAYVIDPQDQKRVEDTAKRHQLAVIAVVHSHPDHDVYFSDEDRQNAAPWGEPLFEGVSYVVISVHNRVVTGMSDFYWDKNNFIEEKL